MVKNIYTIVNENSLTEQNFTNNDVVEFRKDV